MAQGHIEKLLTLPEVKIAAFADISEASIARTQTRHGAAVADVPTSSDYNALPQAVKPNAVLIATPHTLHYPMAIDCLEADCHVLLEKPMVNKVSEAHALLKKIDETNVPINGLRTIEPTEAAWESAASGGQTTAVNRS